MKIRKHTSFGKDKDGWPAHFAFYRIVSAPHSHTTPARPLRVKRGAPSLTLFKGGVLGLDSCALWIVTLVRTGFLFVAASKSKAPPFTLRSSTSKAEPPAPPEPCSLAAGEARWGQLCLPL
jgi:hypothetical protein